MDVLCAAVAGIGARLLCHPLDTVKTVAFTGLAGEPSTPTAGQTGTGPALSSSSRSSFHHAARLIWRQEGVRGLYRGAGVAVLGAAPGVALYLTSYDFFRRELLTLDSYAMTAYEGTEDDATRRRSHLPVSVTYFLSGLGAEAVSCLVWVPIDVAKERLQSQPPALQGRYRGSWDALRTIVRNEGIGGLYRGYWSTLASFGPFSAVYFTCYEAFSAMLWKSLEASGASCHDTSANFTVALLAGAGGNIVASIVANPLELVKTRLQVQRAVLNRSPSMSSPKLFAYEYKGLRDGLRTVVREEGWRALWKGVGSRVAYTAPNAALTMAFYEYLKSSLHRVAPDESGLHV